MVEEHETITLIKIGYIMAKITLKTVQKRILTAQTTTQQARVDVQKALLGLVEHVAVHGDKNVILTNAPDWIKSAHGLNRKAMVDFLVKFGGVVVEGSEFVADKNSKADFKAAKDTDWWTLKVDQPFKGFDLDAKIAALIKEAVKAVETAEKGGDNIKALVKVDVKTLTKLQAV